MSSINRIIIMGRVGRDPEPTTTKSGKTVCKFGVATQRDKETADWHNVVTFDKTAEIAGKYLIKGSLVAIEGRMQYDTWEKDGVKRTSASIIADRLTLIRDKPEPKGDQPRKAKPAPYDAGDGYDRDIGDDIPF